MTQIQIVGFNDSRLAQYYRLFNCMLKLPDVSGPRILKKFFMRLLVYFKAGFIVFIRIFFQEEFSKNENIIAPLPQRRQFDLYCVNPVKKVLPEETIPDHAFQILVCCTYQPDVSWNHLV